MGFVDELNFDPERIPSVKLAAHIVQIVLSFVIWCMEIAVFRGEGAKVVGNNGWTFAVVRTATKLSSMYSPRQRKKGKERRKKKKKRLT
jgi:hypothetical protein